MSFHINGTWLRLFLSVSKNEVYNAFAYTMLYSLHANCPRTYYSPFYFIFICIHFQFIILGVTRVVSRCGLPKWGSPRSGILFFSLPIGSAHLQGTLGLEQRLEWAPALWLATPPQRVPRSVFGLSSLVTFFHALLCLSASRTVPIKLPIRSKCRIHASTGCYISCGHCLLLL